MQRVVCAGVCGGGAERWRSTRTCTHSARRCTTPARRAVFDTAILTRGHLYQLDQHFERFLNSAYKANIPLPSGAPLGSALAAPCPLLGHCDTARERERPPAPAGSQG